MPTPLSLPRTLGRLTLLVLLLVTGSCTKTRRIAETDRFPGIADWPRFGGDLQNRHVSVETLRPPFELAWTKKASAAIGQSLIVVDGVVYFATMDGRIYAVDALSGKQFWKMKTKGRTAATCIYAQGSLVIAYRYGRKSVRRYDLEEKKTVWQLEAGAIETEPLVVDRDIFVASVYERLRCFDFATGTPRWVFEAEGQLHSSPASADSLVVFGTDRGYVYAVRRRDGSQAWRFRADAADLAAPTVEVGRVYVGSSAGTFYALDADSGRRRWQFGAGGRIFQSAATDGRQVLVGTARHHLVSIDTETGKELWRFSAQSVVSTSPMITSNLVFVGSLDHHYYAVDLQTGKLVWRYQTRGRVRTDPVVWGGRLFGGSEDNLVYSFIPAEGPAAVDMDVKPSVPQP